MFDILSKTVRMVGWLEMFPLQYVKVYIIFSLIGCKYFVKVRKNFILSCVKCGFWTVVTVTEKMHKTWYVCMLRGHFLTSSVNAVGVAVRPPRGISGKASSWFLPLFIDKVKNEWKFLSTDPICLHCLVWRSSCEGYIKDWTTAVDVRCHKRERGNWWYTRQEHTLAIQCYRRALDYLGDTEGGITLKPEEGDDSSQVRTKDAFSGYY